MGQLSGLGHPPPSPPNTSFQKDMLTGFEAPCSFAINVLAEKAFCSFHIPSVSASWIFTQLCCPLSLLMSRFQFMLFFWVL